MNHYTIFKSNFLRFKYELLFENMLDFHTARQWLSQTYSHAENTDHCDCHDIDPKTVWSWKLEYRKYMIYLQSDNELGWFKLIFGS